MEFRYADGQNGRTASPPPHPLSAVAYVSRCPSRGSEFAPSGFSRYVLAPRVFSTAVPINADEAFRQELEKERRELEKEEIRRQIIASEMAMARRRRELEDEVRREMASERAFRMRMQRSEGISFQDSVFNSSNMFGSSQFHLPSLFQVDNKHVSTQTNNNKVILLPKPNADNCGEKRKVVTPAVDDCESSQKKAKQEWSCELCQVTATSEKGLKDHIQGKKHKAKASLKTQKIGLDSRLDGQTFHPFLTPANTGKLESREENQVVHKNKGLGGLDNQNETTTSKEARLTNVLTKGKKFKFWCPFCQVGTQSEIVMENHKNGKKHQANMKKN